MSDQQDLFDVGERATHPGNTCTAAPIGSGPEGETCGSCQHLYRHKMAKTYLKCGLMQRFWTGGGATDIKARWPACKYWEAPND